MNQKILAFSFASAAIILMNFSFEGGFKIEKVLISFLIYLVLKSVFSIAMNKILK